MKYVVLLILFSFPCLGLVNEIMYNPEGSDNRREFIEILGNNLSNYTVGDLFGNDSLTEVQFVLGNYSLIVSEGFNYSGINASIYEVTGNIGNGLSNSGDTIFVYYNNTIVANITYENKAESGYSLEYYSGSYIQSLVINGTPGRINSYYIDNISNISVNESAEVNQTEVSNTINSTNTTNNCNVSLGLELEKQIYEAGEKISFKNTVSSSDDFMVEYWVENLDGDIIKNKINTTNSNSKQYTPKERILIFKNSLHVDCNNTGNEENSVLVVAKVEENSCEEYIDKIEKLENQKTPKLNCGGSIKSIKVTPKGNIESFYSRKKKYDSVINLFSKIKGKGFYTLYINSQIEDYNRTIVINNSETIELDVRAEQGKNLYSLELIDAHGKVLDVEKLVVSFPEEKEVEVAVKVEKESEIAPKEIIPRITSSVVYEQEKSSLPTNMIWGTFVLGIIAVLFLLVKYIKPGLFEQKHEQERDQEESRRRLDQSQYDLRNSWQPERARRERLEKLHGEYQNR